jgi:hypothetical protein
MTSKKYGLMDFNQMADYFWKPEASMVIVCARENRFFDIARRIIQQMRFRRIEIYGEK